MKSQEAAIYREIQKETDHAVKMLDALSEMVYDEDLALQISRQSLQYSRLHDEATGALLDARAEGYRASQLTDLAMRTGVRYNTLLNASTGHIAELMIKSGSNSMLELEKALKHNEGAGETSRELARRLISLQQTNISSLKDYL